MGRRLASVSRPGCWCADSPTRPSSVRSAVYERSPRVRPHVEGSPRGSGAIACTPGAPLLRRLRRFGVHLAFLGGHLPDDERPGVHLAIELALALLLALLVALFGCRHGIPSSSLAENHTPRLPRVRLSAVDGNGAGATDASTMRAWC